MKAKLVYPGSMADSPDSAWITVEVRLTRTQIVVESSALERGGDPRRPLFYADKLQPRRFDRIHGFSIPYRSRAWRLAPGEVKRLNQVRERKDELERGVRKHLRGWA